MAHGAKRGAVEFMVFTEKRPTPSASLRREQQKAAHSFGPEAAKHRLKVSPWQRLESRSSPRTDGAQPDRHGHRRTRPGLDHRRRQLPFHLSIMGRASTGR